MRLYRELAVLVLLLAVADPLHAQPPVAGSVTGTVTDQATHAPLENATVLLRSRADSTRVAGTTTGKDGSFAFAGVPFGTYFAECGLIGHTSVRTPAFVLGAAPTDRLMGSPRPGPSPWPAGWTRCEARCAWNARGDGRAKPGR